MKLLIFGSTGSIGRQLVSQALQNGHMVTAFLRKRSKLIVKHKNLYVVQGDAMDFSAVADVVPGHDAVLCSLGAGAKGTVRSEGTKNIVRAMENANIKRFICQSTLGVGDSWENLNFFWRYLMFKGLLRLTYADHVGQEKFVEQSHLDWTIVRPAAFTDGAHTGIYRHGFDNSDRTIQLKISRADVADFMLKQLTENTYLRHTPGLSY